MVGSTQQRVEVWKGIRKKTSGGLVKADLIKNKRGKIVSKAKSSQASSQNNLGAWIREKGKSIPKAEMLQSKSKPPEKKQNKKGPKPVAPKKPVPRKKKSASNQTPKKKPATAPKKPTAPKKKPVAKPGVNPLTNQAYDPNSRSEISLDNVRKRRLRPRKKVSYVY